MATRQRKSTPPCSCCEFRYPLLKTVEQMSRISGIGEGKLRQLMEQRKIEYVQNGNRRLLSESAVWDWYERNKIPVKKTEV